MNVLVTGSYGFIGEYVTSLLIKHGHCVNRFDRKAQKEHNRGDVSKYGKVREEVKDMDWIIHLAAVADVWNDDKSEIFDSNILGVRNIQKAAFDEEIPVLFASSITAQQPTNLYSETKLIGENILEANPSQSAWFRLSNVVGPGTKKGQVAAMVEEAVTNQEIEVWGNGHIKRSYIPVEQVAQEFINIVLSGRNEFKSGYLKTLGTQTLTNEQVARLIQSYAPAEIELTFTDKMPPSPKELTVSEDELINNPVQSTEDSIQEMVTTAFSTK